MAKSEPVEKSPLALFMAEYLPDTKLRVSGDVRTLAGRKLADGHPAEEVIALLKAGDNGDIQPPAKCSVLKMSRPFNEWPITKFTRDLHAYVCGTSVEDPENPKKRRVVGGLTKDERQAIQVKDLLSKDNQTAWFKQIGVDSRNLCVQEVDKVIKHVFKLYDGVEKKVNNRNAAKQAKLDAQNKRRALEGRPELPPFVPETAYGEDGRLLQPPGPNPNIYFVQQSKFRALDPQEDAHILEALGLESYSLNPDQPIPIGKGPGGSVVDRLAIPKGQPGYIPEHQRALVNPQRGRIRQRANAKAAGMILGTAQMGEDWVALDIRGLLRNVRWRKIGTRKLTPNELRGLFTGDPVIDPIRNIATCLYKPEAIKRWSKKPVLAKSNEVLLREAPVTLVSVDIGVTNPVAVKVSYVKAVDEQPSATMRARFSYKDIAETVGSRMLDDIQRLKLAHDNLEVTIRQLAESALSSAEQNEIAEIRKTSAETAKAKVAEFFGIDPNVIPWDQVSNQTYFIADEVLKRDPTSQLVYEMREGKKKKKNGKVVQAPAQLVKRKDSWIAHQKEIRPQLSDETRKALHDKVWEIQRSHEGYRQLAKRKEELARKIRNQVFKRARLATGVENLAVNIERLSNIKAMHGRGKRQLGWNALFQPKQENRWMMQALHKAFLEVASTGITVITSPPERTSITCTQCCHVDANNRSGTDFKCLKCGFMANTDLEIATDNLERVALTGRAMPKALKDGERLSDAPKSGVARKGQTPDSDEESEVALHTATA